MVLQRLIVYILLALPGLTSIAIPYVLAEAERRENMSMSLSSSAFEHKGSIPAEYTCDGKDISPELSWKGVPDKAQSLVLIVDDPDAPDPAAPKMIWVHWILYNLPVNMIGLGKGIRDGDLPPGTLHGLNDWRNTGYNGPCPPVGRHRYYYKLYALNTVLPDLARPTKAKLEQAMAGHVIEKAILIGTYQH